MGEGSRSSKSALDQSKSFERKETEVAATFDMQRFTDRFRPLATEHELRATFDAVDDLRDEAATAFAEEVGGAVGAADAAIAPARKVVRAAADALRGIADRLRERRGAGDGSDDA